MRDSAAHGPNTLPAVVANIQGRARLHRQPAAHPCRRIRRTSSGNQMLRNGMPGVMRRKRTPTPDFGSGAVLPDGCGITPGISPGLGFHVMSGAKRPRGNVRFARNLAAASRLETWRRPRASAFRAVCPATNAHNEFCENSQALPGWCQEEKMILDVELPAGEVSIARRLYASL